MNLPLSAPHSHRPSMATYPPGQDLRNLTTLFPHVEDDLLMSIIRHELPGIEVYKLDSRRILESQWNFLEVSVEDSSISVRPTPSASELYHTLDSLLVPLNAYFSILCLHGLANGQPPMLPCHFFRYSSHLVKITAQYEWSAVVLYHLASFSRRCREMRAGDYTGWGRVDMDLMEEFLVPNQKHSHPKPRKNGRQR
ncbi:hypothetical protein A0H81_04070 [Grifola frondosa]|uniref:Uncharacterized protein n=1 Tax=Grifola frondosa TaxID=5627 RepID=A0A1C7MJT4_GRIFR|nr:hypothetical protein A0H81_04070 [Grifola frondosa]